VSAPRPFDRAELETIDHLLSTTRAVRKRLDLERPVPPAVVEECLRLAIQAPTGSNRQGWHWVVVTDADKRAALAEMYRAGFGPYMERARSGSEGLTRVGDSALWLAERLEQVPVHVIPCIEDYTKGSAHAGVWASIYPAVWSFQLALRSRGLGSVLTTLHLPRARHPRRRAAGRARAGRVLHRRRLQAREAPPGRAGHVVEPVGEPPLIRRRAC
jgi:nitroreductase